MKPSSQQNGFTLIELSIVLVTIGLIVGGVLMGKALMRSAQLNAVVGEVARYTQAMRDFKDKYNALPGDMYNAESIWGTDPAGCPDPSSGVPATPFSTAPQKATCNGNGDGRIQSTHEPFRFWQQLANAGLIEGGFSGMPDVDTVITFMTVPGINMPRSKIDSGAYSVYFDLDGINGNFTGRQYPAQHSLLLGRRQYDSGADGAYWPVMTAQEALGIDEKIDDGMPNKGKVMTIFSTSLYGTSCLSSNDETAPYSTEVSSSNTCSLRFLTGM